MDGEPTSCVMHCVCCIALPHALLCITHCCASWKCYGVYMLKGCYLQVTLGAGQQP